MPVVKKMKGNASALSQNSEPDKGPRKETNLSLPTKFNEPPRDFHDYCILYYGDKGWGKSSLSALHPGAITLMTEPRRRNLRIRQIPDASKNEKPLNWARFKGYCHLIEDAKDIQTPIFDTVDRAYNLCFADVCSRHKVKHPQEMKGYEGAQLWHTIKLEFEECINSLCDAGKTPVFISHARWREVVTVSGDKFEQTTPTCTDACWTILKAITDFAFYLGFIAQQRTIVVRGNDRIWASCGVGEDHFLDKKGRPLASLLAGNSPKQAYQTLMDGYANKRNGDLYEEYNTDEDQGDSDVELPKTSFKKGKK